jgi:hypothetical protein
MNNTLEKIWKDAVMAYDVLLLINRKPASVYMETNFNGLVLLAQNNSHTGFIQAGKQASYICFMH